MNSQATLQPTGFGTNDVQIMAGTFDDTSFDDIIQVLGLSRQCLRLLVRQGEAAFSEVLLKAGQVLEARTPSSTDPAQVFQTLGGRAVPGSGLSFAVYHTQPTGPFPQPRGRLSDLHALGSRARAGGYTPSPQPASPGVEPTLRIPPPPARPDVRPEARVRTAAPAAPAASAQAPDLLLTSALTSGAADTLSKAVLADLQPLLRHELNTVGVQVREQAQMLATLEGRMQSLPQLVAAEVRLAQAQQDRDAARQAPVAPPPAAPAGHSTAVLAMAVTIAALLAALAVLALR